MDIVQRTCPSPHAFTRTAITHVQYYMPHGHMHARTHTLTCHTRAQRITAQLSAPHFPPAGGAGSQARGGHGTASVPVRAGIPGCGPDFIPCGVQWQAARQGRQDAQSRKERADGRRQRYAPFAAPAPISGADKQPPKCVNWLEGSSWAGLASGVRANVPLPGNLNYLRRLPGQV
eukprot:361475-Chlamydomonas_euryale.AAC.7